MQFFVLFTRGSQSPRDAASRSPESPHGGRSASDFQPVAHSTAGPAVPGRSSGNTRQWCSWERVLL